MNNICQIELRRSNSSLQLASHVVNTCVIEDDTSTMNVDYSKYIYLLKSRIREGIIYLLSLLWDPT